MQKPKNHRYLKFAIAQCVGFHAKKEIMLNVHELRN